MNNVNMLQRIAMGFHKAGEGAVRKRDRRHIGAGHDLRRRRRVRGLRPRRKPHLVAEAAPIGGHGLADPACAKNCKTPPRFVHFPCFARYL